MARRSGFHPQRSRSARLTDWGLGPGGEANTTVTSSSIQIIGSGIATVAGKVTIIRIRGEFSMALAAATAGANGFACAFGIGIVTAPAFAIGATAVPGPLDEADWDGWMYHRFFALLANEALTGGISTDLSNVGAQVASIRVEVDSKAMRKLDEEERLAAIIQTTEIGTATANFMFDSRVLAKLG